MLNGETLQPAATPSLYLYPENPIISSNQWVKRASYSKTEYRVIRKNFDAGSAYDSTVRGIKEGQWSGNQDNWERRAIDQISQLGSIGHNWDSYGSEPPNPIAIENAKNMIKRFASRNIKPAVIAPCPEEGVTLTFIIGEQMATIETYSSGEIIAIKAKEETESEVWEVDPDSPEADIDNIQVHLFGSYGD